MERAKKRPVNNVDPGLLPQLPCLSVPELLVLTSAPTWILSPDQPLELQHGPRYLALTFSPIPDSILDPWLDS